MLKNFAQMLFKGANGLDVADMSPWLDLRTPPKEVKLPFIEAQSHRRFMKTHLPVDALVFSDKAKYIYIGRDCRELPSLQKSYVQYGQDIAMFAVNLNINETDEAIATLLQQSGLTMPIVIDQAGSIASNFNFVGIPFHVLINASGKVVYTTYRDDAKLAYQLQQLVKGEASVQQPPSVNAVPVTAKVAHKIDAQNGYSLLYFSAVWCDSYMLDVEPSIASNCINSVQVINHFIHAHSHMEIQAYVTHLWTQTGELAKFEQRLTLPFKVEIDEQNRLFQYYDAKGYPTLIVLKEGLEVARFTDFTQVHQILEKLEQYSN